ncbi:hypothetical protein HDU92_005104 [Lobulomyces angularis]|nr:hypothetical protein HDU92_005104 [Lobulomyces angularis]
MQCSGNRAFVKGDFVEALSSFEKAVEYNKTSELYNNIGNCYILLQKYKEGFQAFKKSLELNDSKKDVHLNAAKVLEKFLKEPELAKTHYQKALEIEEYETCLKYSQKK